MLSIISLTEYGFRSGVDDVDDDVLGGVLDDVLDDVMDDVVNDVVDDVADDVKDGKVACVVADRENGILAGAEADEANGGEVDGVNVVAIGDVVVVCELDGILCCCVFVDCEVGTRYPTAPS